MSGFSPVRQDTSGKFGCPVLSGLDTHMSSPVEPYLNRELFDLRKIYGMNLKTGCPKKMPYVGEFAS